MKIKSVATTILFIMLSGSQAMATGIPVVDAMANARSIQEGLQRALEAKQALEQAVREYEQAKRFGDDAKRRFEGYSDFSTLFDTAASYIVKDLSDLSNPEKVGSLRQKYGLVSNDPSVQSKYDGMLQKISLYDSFNKQLTENAQQLDQLQNRFATAVTPQQKQDIGNQIQLELVKNQNIVRQYDYAQSKISQESEINQVKRSIERNKAHSYTGQ